MQLNVEKVFSAFPGWKDLPQEVSQRCIDSIPALAAIATRKGFIEEADYEAAGIPQSESEKKAQQNRDSLAQHRRRAEIITSDGSKERREKAKKEAVEALAKAQQLKQIKARKKELEALMKSKLSVLDMDSETGCQRN